MRRRNGWLFALAIIATGCARAAAPATAVAPATAEDGVREAQAMAAAGSRLDVNTLVTFIPQTDRVVYVSDTNPITGNAYRKSIADSYAQMAKLDYHWDKWESTPIGENAVLFTGWATITTVPLKGETEKVHAIVTMVFVRDSTGWKRVIAHKTTIDYYK